MPLSRLNLTMAMLYLLVFQKSVLSPSRESKMPLLNVGIRKLDPVKPYLKTLHWFPIEKWIEFKIAVLTYRCLNCHAPNYLQDLLVLYRPDANVFLRSSSRSVLWVPRTHTKTYGYRAFSVAVPLI
jgi:hypothetical protein